MPQLQKQLAEQAGRLRGRRSELKILNRGERARKEDSDAGTDAYSVRAAENRREGIQHDGKPQRKKQQSNRRGGIKTAEKPVGDSGRKQLSGSVLASRMYTAKFSRGVAGAARTPGLPVIQEGLRRGRFFPAIRR